MANTSEELNLAKGQPADTAATAGSGGKKKLIFIVLALLVLGGVAAGAYFMLGSDAGPEAAAGAGSEPAAAPEEPDTDPIYLALSPAFVINFEQAGRTRYLQIEMQIMSYEQGVIDKVESNMPAVRNGLILLFSDQDYPALNTVEGKEALRKQVLDSVNKVIRAKATDRVHDVFFTGFVMQ